MKLAIRIFFALMIVACFAICTYVNISAAETERMLEVTVISQEAPPPSQTPEPMSESPQSPEPSPEYIPDPEEVTMLAKLVYGEARGIKSQTEQAAVVWCVLNRVDSTGYGMGHSVEYVVTFPDQFHGYNPRHPTVDDYGRDLRELAADVLTRWDAEKEGETDVGRVLPKGYLWFEGKDGHNVFRNAYRGGSKWDWQLPSPYES